jgi:hypothetical protein
LTVSPAHGSSGGSSSQTPHFYTSRPNRFSLSPRRPARRLNDIPGAEPFAHDGDLCSFDCFIRHFGLRDPALERLAVIVRGADTARHDLAPEASGLHAISMGLSINIPDDHAMLEQGMVIYDALYAWCRSAGGEVHNWKPAAAPAPGAVV